MSKLIYIFTVVGSNIAVFVVVVLMIGSGGGISPEEATPVMLLLALIGVVAHLVFIYKFWNSLRDGKPRMGPGKAIGLLFIPIFNIYWIFQVYGGFATDYNRYVQDKGLSAPQLGQGLLVFNVLLLLFSIPVLNWIVQSIAIAKICDAVNKIRK
jgi:hypothetical protein